MIRVVLLGLLCASGPSVAQETIEGAEELFGSDEQLRQDQENGVMIPLGRDEVTEEENERVSQGRAAVLRGLDRLTGRVLDIEVGIGQTREFGRLDVTLAECRYPETNPAGNAYAYLTIGEAGKDAPDFAGWMVASAPALNPLDHPRYDIWVMRCIT
jgi:hypothetical protein